MGNLIGGFKRFLTNKNTVTILAILAGILVLWFFYNMRVSSAVKPVLVPIASEEIGATDQITLDKLKFVEVSADFLADNDIITSSQLLDGKYVTTGTSVPKGGLFHQSQVVEKSELPNAVFDDIPEGDGLVYLRVDNNSTYGNSIYPGDKIDLYAQYTDDTGILVFGKFIEKIEVLAVRDSSQNDVFESTETGESALLLFTVPEELFNLISTAQGLGDIEIIPVPRNKDYTTSEGTTKVTSATIQNYIEARSNIATDQ